MREAGSVFLDHTVLVYEALLSLCLVLGFTTAVLRSLRADVDFSLIEEVSLHHDIHLRR